MIIIAGFAAALCLAVAAGARPSSIGSLRFRNTPLVMAAIVLQILVVNIVHSLPTGVAAGAHLASYGLAVSFLILNRKVSGLWLLGLGGLMNLAAIAANGGVMPASPAALTRAGIEQEGHFVNSAVVDHPRLAFLGDVMAVPEGWPLANVFSIGDVVLVIGAGGVLLGTRRPRSTEPANDPLPEALLGAE